MRQAQTCEAQRGITQVARDPVDPLYAKQWKFSLPASHFQAIDAPGRPPAHRDFLRSHDALVGPIPNEEAIVVRTADHGDGGNPKEIRNSGIRPDMMKRGAGIEAGWEVTPKTMAGA
jgi:hypothetical protein